MRKGRAVDCVPWVRSRGWLACLVIGVENTPAVVGCCGCCGRGGLLVVGAPACLCAYWGWHAVGVLGQCALVA